MIDQDLNTRIPISDLREINKCSQHLSYITDVLGKMAKRNETLQMIIKDNCYLDDAIEDMEGCIISIKDEMGDLEPDDFLDMEEKLDKRQMMNTIDGWDVS